MSRPHYKRYAYLAFILFMLVICWEYNLSGVALAQGEIPEQSIRLRILAHSDAPQDQWIKLKIRDEVIRYMRIWVQDPRDINEARQGVQTHLPQFEQLVGDVLAQYGYTYPYSVELGIVDFPTKIYGSERYPAGDYEALRIVIGDGKGENWWCVLFPPLCFVDLTTSVTVTEREDTAVGQVESVSKENIEARFFLWDLMKSLFGGIKQ